MNETSTLMQAGAQIVSLQKEHDALLHELAAKDARIAELESELSTFRELVGGTDDTTTMTRKSFVEVLQALSDTKAKLDRAEGEAQGLKAIIKTAEKDRDIWCMQASSLKTELTAANARIAELETAQTAAEHWLGKAHELQIALDEARKDAAFQCLRAADKDAVITRQSAVLSEILNHRDVPLWIKGLIKPYSRNSQDG